MIEHVNIPEERLLILKRSSGWFEKLREFLDVKVDVNDDVSIDGDPIHVLRAKEIIKALGRGFNFEECLDLLDDNYYLEIMEVKDFTGKARNRQLTMKGRIIGEGGKTKKMIEKSADVKLAVYGKTVSIIGKVANIKTARAAIEMILFGSKHNTVYRFLSEHKVI